MQLPSNTTTIFAKKNMLAALAVASVLFLATGCAPELNVGGVAGDSGSGSSNSGGSGNSDADGNNKTVDDQDKGNDKDGNSDKSANATLTGKACFPGNWIADNTDIQGYMELASGGASISTTGHVILTYNTDGTTVTTYDHWTNTIKLAGSKSVVERHGVDKGTYTVSDTGTFTASDTSIGSVTSMTMTAGGQVVTMSVDPEPSVFETGIYKCSGDLLTMTVDGYDLKLFREH